MNYNPFALLHEILNQTYMENENYIVIDGKQISLPQELVDNIKKNLSKVDALPTEWELEKGKYYYFTNGCSEINYICVSDDDLTHPYNLNSLPTEELAEAMLALCQLLVMRDRYNGDWKPDWADDNLKYCISIEKNEIEPCNFYSSQEVIAFKTEEIRDAFLDNFIDLIEIAKPLL